MVERIPSGIPGLDEMIDGGIPAHSITLVTGNTGSGKTTFCLQFLWEGLQAGETCLYITTEELPNQIRADASEIGMDLSEYDGSERFNLLYVDPSTKTDHVNTAIRQAIDQIEPDRVVIDSLSVIGAYWGDETEVRANLHHLVKDFRDREITTVVTGERPDQDTGRMTRSGVTEFLVDGVIALGGLSIGKSTFRSMQVIKMRKTAIEEDIYGLELTGDGMRVEEQETF